jgi:purine-binding chemotaxis protein CheW
MSGQLAMRAAALRENFDRGFAAPRQAGTPDVVDFLAISVDAAPYAIRLADIASLSTDHVITAIPGQLALRGLAGFRGAMLPVYGLAALLGHDTTAAERWLARAPPVAFAFTRFEGHLRLPAGQIVAQAADAPARRHVRGFLEHETHIRPILDMASLFEAVRILAGATKKEQDQP